MVILLNILSLVGLLSAIAFVVAGLPTVLIGRHKKRRAIRDYVRRLGRVLRVRYGIQSSYKTAQVIHMMRKWGYSSSYDGYGLALYCSQTDFEHYYSSMREPYDYHTTRREISAYLPFVDADFSAAEVVELGDRLNELSRAQKGSHSKIRDSSDLDKVSTFISDNKGRDYGNNFEDRSRGGSGSPPGVY